MLKPLLTTALLTSPLLLLALPSCEPSSNPDEDHVPVGIEGKIEQPVNQTVNIFVSTEFNYLLPTAQPPIHKPVFSPVPPLSQVLNS